MSLRFLLSVMSALSVGALVAAGTAVAAAKPKAPVLTSVTPTAARAGQTVTLRGTGFYSPDGLVVATFGTWPAHTQCPTRDRCVVTVPARPAGAYRLRLHTEYGTSNALRFMVRAG